MLAVNSPTHDTSSQWQSGFLSYAIAQLITEFSSVDPIKVIEAVNAAIDEVPVAEGGVALVGRARELLCASFRKSA